MAKVSLMRCPARNRQRLARPTSFMLPMCCLSRRNGAVQMVRDSKSAIAYLRGGQIVHAETTGARGRDAIQEIVHWQYVEFGYDKTVRPPVETITATWDELLIDAVAK